MEFSCSRAFVLPVHICVFPFVCLFFVGVLSSELKERSMAGILSCECERKDGEDREASVNRVIYF